jgi:hypothetical protein
MRSEGANQRGKHISERAQWHAGQMGQLGGGAVYGEGVG